METSGDSLNYLLLFSLLTFIALRSSTSPCAAGQVQHTAHGPSTTCSSVMAPSLRCSPAETMMSMKSHDGDARS